MVRAEVQLPEDYDAFLEGLRRRVLVVQRQVQRAVNRQLIALYWEIGSAILEQQSERGWGTGVITRLAEDLRRSFPEMTGLSRSNLQYMRAFAAAWEGDVNVPRTVGHLPWGHIRVLLDKLDDRGRRDWYAHAAVEHGWSRDMLLSQIKNRTLERSGAAPSNFTERLPAAESALAQQIAKDPYVFDFLDLREGVAEREFELALTSRITQTLGELGTGFAFVGRQVHFEVSGRDFYVDLLFFHVTQLRYVVVELKRGEFDPAFAGQLGFYIALVEGELRAEQHAPTIGILICGDKDERIVRYALSQSASPIAVATYTYESLPPEEQRALPDAQRLLHAIPAESV